MMVLTSSTKKKTATWAEVGVEEYRTHMVRRVGSLFARTGLIPGDFL
jgi:hypothetical protein